MPEENLRPALLQALQELEDPSLENHLKKSHNYRIVHCCLENEVEVNFDKTIIDRILKICTHGMKNMKHAADIINIISVILNKMKTEEYKQLPDLLPSAVSIINVYNATGLMNNLGTLRTLCVETILSFPDVILVAIATEHYDVLMQLFDKTESAKTHVKIRVLTYDVLHKILMILPPEKKKDFVKAGVVLWFSSVIPAIVTLTTYESTDVTKFIDLLESLTDVLLTINYNDSPHWPPIMECICNPKKYPQIMKNLLENGSPLWHRIWIVFIKLLNNQITRSTVSSGTPINFMLPVVENAFKMDAVNRCKAFQCWSVLIDIFSKETNDNCIMKRLKLLIIPLRLNNAKVDNTAMAKFDAWWHLITKFQTKLDKFIDTVLIAFLHFCFGKHNSSGKTSFVPGQLSVDLKRRTVQAFIEIIGHVDCEGCTDVTRLKHRLINTKYLVDYWNDWAHSLKIATKIAIDNNNKQHIICLWKSFLYVIAQLPDSNVKNGVLVGLLATLASSLQDCRCDDISDDIVFKAVISSIFKEELKLTNFLKANEFQAKGVLSKIVSIILDPSLKSVYQKLTTQEINIKLKPLTDFIVSESSKCSSKICVELILRDIPSNDTTLMLWSALAETTCNLQYEMCPKELCYLLQWPLKSSNMFTDVQSAASTWHKLYDLNFFILSKNNIDTHISQLLLSCNIVMHSSIYFTLCATTAILKNGLGKNSNLEYQKEAVLLKTLLNRIDDYKSIKEVFPMLIDTLVVMINNATNTVNEKFAQITLMTVKIILKLIIPVMKLQSDVAEIITLLRMLLKSIESLFEIELYSKLDTIIMDSMIEEQLHVKDLIQTLLKVGSKNVKENQQTVCDSIDLTSDDMKKDSGVNFTTPNIKEVPKKGKKKEASIVNTVVENGEEYVVVKSNWKFNPRKLTENQKEKLQRKREDIPALYQDLSQSQDEFKMSVWKTDSQDTTTSKSSSKSINEGSAASNILNKLINTDVVPKIMENILAEKGTKEIDKVSDKSNIVKAKDGPTQMTSLTPKHTKTLRMALKDRVFRNVRNLIEKSTSSNSKDQNISCNQIENPKTPTSKPTDMGNVVNSAPSLLLCDRPSRVKRKPKKFDDTEIFAIKKRRNSQSDSQANNEEIEINPETNITEPRDTLNSCRDKENHTILSENCVRPLENLDDAKVIEDDSALENIKATSVAEAINKIEIVTCGDDSISPADNDITKSLEFPSTVIEQNNITDEKVEPDNESATAPPINESEVVSTPKSIPFTENDLHTLSTRKSSVKKSRIEKELAIDMVEGHPFLNTPTTSEKRKTRKNIVSSINSSKRKKLADKLNKLKSDTKTPPTTEKGKTGIRTTNIDDMSIADDKSDSPENVLACEESCSEDIIESSQDSTLTTITVIKKTPKRLPVVSIEKMQLTPRIDDATENLLDDNQSQQISNENENVLKNYKDDKIVTNVADSEETCAENEQKNYKKLQVQNVENPETCEDICSENLESTTDINCSLTASEVSLLHQETNDDTELPRNKSVAEDKNVSELTENMDTAPILEQDIFDDVIVINDDDPPIISVSSDENIVGPQTQEIAEAETQPNDTTNLDIKIDTREPQESTMQKSDEKNTEEALSNIINTDTIPVSMATTILTEETADVSSPFKDDVQRKQDFLNNTIEISPIKTVSPDREKKSPSPDRSGDYVIIKLSSPVQSNGEPFEKGSPEFFTEEKISPDKRDQSPPRAEVTATNTSPSSSLSLKKNRPQVRSIGGGRAAQMLGLCVLDKLNPLMSSERIEVDEGRKSSPCNTPARRNLRILYNSVGDNSDNGETEENASFLKLKRSLPTTSSSPSGPILKRKLAEIVDDATVSPANKRKRVSFHDPPVSTTISVQKYIEPCGVRSPQNSAHKRQERQARMQANLKSPKRLDNFFTLDSVLTKTVESFTDVDLSLTNTEDTQTTSLDQTPSAEIVKTSELNDTDPICPQLVDCKDPIDIIAVELSSPVMKMLLIKELDGKIATIGDLAKMTELEVNRLCIKAPKVKVAKKVLTEYANKIESNTKATERCVDLTVDVDIVPIDDFKLADIGVQTNELVTNNAEMQTCDVSVSLVSTQTEMAHTSSISVQTEESGSKTTAEIIQMCLLEKSDFVAQLSEHLHDCSLQQIANKLSFKSATDTLMTKVDEINSKVVIDRLLEHQCTQETDEQKSNKQLLFLRDYLCDKFESKDLILFCSELLKKVYDKPL